MPKRKPRGRPLFRWQRYSHLILAGLALIAAWLYLPPYADSFIGDDFVQQWRIRHLVHNPAGAYRILSPFWTDWYYRPAQNLWFLANRLLFGLQPAAYYALQIGWHLLAVALVYRLARRLGLGRPGALAGAALFAINAQHALTVSWISSIAIIMAAVFSLVAVLCLPFWRQGDKETRRQGEGEMSWPGQLRGQGDRAAFLPLPLSPSPPLPL
ncbi:MAG: hypothetical protein L0322_24055, partial [Chloroflexi bacterium]|nr:hypothetical protein [Chloroflexota bacterium]